MACVDELRGNLVRRGLVRDCLQSHCQKLDDLCKLADIERPQEEVRRGKLEGLHRSVGRHAFVQSGDMVALSEVFNPHLFYVCKTSNAPQMRQLKRDLTRSFSDLPPLDRLWPEMLCSVESNGSFERAYVLQDEDQSVEVFLLDLGICARVERGKVRALPHDLVKRLPFQAVECKLVNVKPPNGAEEWCEEAGDYLWNFGRNEEEERSCDVQLTVIDKKGSHLIPGK